MMDQDNEESLREAASIGNFEEISKLIGLGVDINSKNKVNGWSSLHWAAKRGHIKAVQILLKAGADKDIQNINGEIPSDLTRIPEIRSLLGAPITEEYEMPGTEPEFQPNYMRNPGFIYSKASHNDSSKTIQNHPSNKFHYQPESIICTAPSQWAPAGLLIHPEFIVLRVRLGHVSKLNNDFLEVEISRQELPTLEQLTRMLCESLEMGINPEQVRKIKKLPQSVLRSDRDVQRLTDYQALEIILLPEALHPFDGFVLTADSDSRASPDSRYLKEQVSKLVY